MNYTQGDSLHAVRDAIRERFDIDVPLHIEYPGFIAIPENIVNDYTDMSAAVWNVGPGDEAGSWSGQLTTSDGQCILDAIVANFVVWPVSQDVNDIADAIYAHGIGDNYTGGGCPNCPVRRRQ